MIFGSSKLKSAVEIDDSKLFAITVNGQSISKADMRKIAEHYYDCEQAEHAIRVIGITDIPTAIKLGGEVETRVIREVYDYTNIPEETWDDVIAEHNAKR